MTAARAAQASTACATVSNAGTPSIVVPPRPGAVSATMLVPAARMPAICALP
jgi:hypothetical protein